MQYVKYLVRESLERAFESAAKQGKRPDGCIIHLGREAYMSLEHESALFRDPFLSYDINGRVRLFGYLTIVDLDGFEVKVDFSYGV